MNKTAATALTILAALAAIAAPVFIAIYEARKQAVDTETARVLSYARDAVRRTDATATQIDLGIRHVVDARRGDPCSEASLVPMRDVDVASSYIQAIGYVEHDTLICSSLGQDMQHVPLGPIDAVTERNVGIRLNVTFPFAPNATFIVVERDSYAVIIHKDLPIDVTTQESDVSLAAFLMDGRRILTARGYVKPAWLEALRTDREVTFVDGPHIVAVVPSTHFFIAAVAAAPLAHVNDRVRALAWLLVPIGFVAGGGLGLAVIHLARLQLAMPAVLKTALRRGEFFLAYQPFVDLHSGQWAGAEVLIRWRRPNGEMVRPDLFVSVAEDAGLIERVTERVVELVTQDAADIARRFPDFAFSINLSPADLKSRRTVDLFRRLVREAGISNVIVEVTERGLLDRDQTREIVHDLRALGVRVAIDDFGTGFSSLSYLESMELDLLKIDKSFVESLNTDAPTSGVAFHIIQMGKTLNLQITAEGVQTDAQAQCLRDYGVHYGQGWLFAKPMSRAELIAALVHQRDARAWAGEAADQT
jgi:sensor c-di-GMP phosphodiesterase-like protein